MNVAELERLAINMNSEFDRDRVEAMDELCMIGSKLIRRAIAAEKLAEALKKADEALHDDGCRPTTWPRPHIKQAITAYEATK